jgi:predicted glycosyltransferase
MQVKKQIKALFCINTPAQAYTWRYVIENLIRRGHKVRILARDYESTVGILANAGLQAYTFRPFKKKYLPFFEIIPHLYNGLKVSKGFVPTIIIGFGVDAALTAGLLRRPCIVFTDGDSVCVQNFLTKFFASAILTPECFAKDLGKKHLRIDGYKELAYLHPDYFKPDPSIFHELGLAENEKYIILRFNSFNAIHDIGASGFKDLDKIALVKELQRYAHIFISYEGALPKEIEVYRLPTAFNRIHHVLYYANMIVADAGMISEAAILGTPGIMCGSKIKQFGNLDELESKYGLIYLLPDPAEAISQAIKLAQQPDLKGQYVKKRQKLIGDKIDVTRFLVNFIENYPDSLKEYEEKRNK